MLVPREIGWKTGDPEEALLTREWLVTNGLGGYASGTVGGTATRRFHGRLIAALPAPLGRTMMLNHVDEWVSGEGDVNIPLHGGEALEEFAVELGIPTWRYRSGPVVVEKRVVMPYGQNTSYSIFRLVEGAERLTLRLAPAVKFRHHEGLGLLANQSRCETRVTSNELEITESESDLPSLRVKIVGPNAAFRESPRVLDRVLYVLERDRGYDHEGSLWSPGSIELELVRGEDAGFVASIEEWDVIHALTMSEVLEAVRLRATRLIERADPPDELAAQLVLAADQFLIRPTTRSADRARIAAGGDSPRTVIAGYHWFTDWGRDTMISLEGLTLTTGRYREAGSILRTFASYIRDGLIPNMFPEGEHGGLYHTVDATMWFFHAVARYVRWTNDRNMLRALLPKMVEIIDHHVRGTSFNIRVDPADGLLTQGEEGYQLTWMDAKVDGWVVTPRRGKAVEVNALYYNALRVLEGFLEEEGDDGSARRMRELAERAYASFNARFWYEEGQHLYDVIDEHDPALRPNQIFAVSLDHPVLDPSRWKRVVEVVERELVTPVGLRSLSPGHPDYKRTYDGDLRSRDAAYHQGTVWGWLIGPFFDAWLKVHGSRSSALRFLDGFRPHLGEACIGTISEVFDAEPPYAARGCAAQAWSVAEVLRCLMAAR